MTTQNVNDTTLQELIRYGTKPLYKNVRILADGSMSSCNASGVSYTPLGYELNKLTYSTGSNKGVFCYTDALTAKVALAKDKQFRGTLRGAILMVIPVGDVIPAKSLFNPSKRSDVNDMVRADAIIPTKIVFLESTEVDVTDEIEAMLVGKSGSPDLGKRIKLYHQGNVIATIGWNGNASDVVVGYKVTVTNTATSCSWFKVFKTR